MSLFRCLGRTKVSVQVREFVCKCFITNIGFHSEELLAPRPTPKLEDHHLSAVCYCLFNLYIRSYPPYSRPFLHPEPEDAPCRGDRDRITAWTDTHTHNMQQLLPLNYNNDYVNAPKYYVIGYVYCILFLSRSPVRNFCYVT
jgi:hypothetical protein